MTRQEHGTPSSIRRWALGRFRASQATHPPRQGLLFTNIPQSAFRNPHFLSGVALHQRSAFRIPHSAFPTFVPVRRGRLQTPQSAIRNSRFSFVMRAKPAEGIVLPIGGGNL